MPYRRLILLLAILPAGGFLPGFVLECRPQVMPHLAITVQPDPQGDLEDELLMLTNRHRTQQGLQALSPDETLSKIAREHSMGMATQGFISHDLPEGNLEARMNRGGYLYETARENLAAASTVAYAESALMESPAHKSNILAVDVDRVGIGIVRCAPPFEKQLYITEIFASQRQVYPASGVHNALAARIDDLRQTGAGALLPDPVLERLASDSVQILHVPVDREELRGLLASSAGELRENGRTEITRVEASVQLLRNPRHVSVPNHAPAGQQARIFGTAVRRVAGSRNQPAFLVLILIGFSKENSEDQDRIRNLRSGNRESLSALNESKGVSYSLRPPVF